MPTSTDHTSAHVATIIDADIDGPIPYVVTRWVPGLALR